MLQNEFLKGQHLTFLKECGIFSIDFAEFTTVLAFSSLVDGHLVVGVFGPEPTLIVPFKKLFLRFILAKHEVSMFNELALLCAVRDFIIEFSFELSPWFLLSIDIDDHMALTILLLLFLLARDVDEICV